MAVNNPHRPNCPKCGNELVFAALVIGNEQWSAWLCDCVENPNPPDVRRDVVLARDWDEQSIVYKFNKVGADHEST